MGKRLVLAVALCALAATSTAADAQVVVPGGEVAENWPSVPIDPVVEVATADCPVESDETGDERKCEPTQVAGASLLCTYESRYYSYERSCSIDSEPAGAGCRREGEGFIDWARWTESCSASIGDTTVGYTCDGSSSAGRSASSESRHCTAGPVTVGEEWSSNPVYDSGALTVGVGDAGVRCADDRTEEGHDDGYRPEDCTVTAPGSG